MERIAVIGLGYVGLPLAVALARHHPSVIGFDIASRRVDALRAGEDKTGEVPREALTTTRLDVTNDPDRLNGASVFIVTVPTPVDADLQPDLAPLRRACEIIGPRMERDALVIFESTVYPGVTEDICGPWLAIASGLQQGSDFTLGYSPERINPGDREHTLERVVKVISAENEVSLARLDAIYGPVIEAGLHRAPSIKVAEAAKVIENTQRDLNIALMNELAMIFDRVGIASRDVLAAAETKWNFLRFTPGLVGGHCIGVDPYYLTSLAQRRGYHPEMILAGRRINDGMGAFVARKTVKLLIANGRAVPGSQVAVLGLTFKENVGDLRNSKVVDVVRELRDFGLAPMVHDPLADPDAASDLLGEPLAPQGQLDGLAALVLTVPHKAYFDGFLDRILMTMQPGGVVVDVKASLGPNALGRDDLVYWSL